MIGNLLGTAWLPVMLLDSRDLFFDLAALGKDTAEAAGFFMISYPHIFKNISILTSLPGYIECLGSQELS